MRRSARAIASSPPPIASAPGTERVANRNSVAAANRVAKLSRPAAIFGSTASRTQPPPSLFGGEELLSDKSLDEVILSYLAEDLEPHGRK